MEVREFSAYESWFVYATDPHLKTEDVPPIGVLGEGSSGESLKKRIALQKEGDAREKAWLVALNPVTQKERWRVPAPKVTVTAVCSRRR